MRKPLWPVGHRAVPRTTVAEPAGPGPGFGAAAISSPPHQTSCGSATSPMSARGRAGCTWPSSWTRSAAVVGWAMADHLRTELATAALEMACGHVGPPGLIHHSDRGVQYTSTAYGDLFADYEHARASVDRALVGTMPWPRASSHAQDRSLSTATLGQRAVARSQPFLSSLPAGTTSTAAIPLWASSAPPKSNGAPHLVHLRPNRSLHRSGSTPLYVRTLLTRGRCDAHGSESLSNRRVQMRSK